MASKTILENVIYFPSGQPPSPGTSAIRVSPAEIFRRQMKVPPLGRTEPKATGKVSLFLFYSLRLHRPLQKTRTFSRAARAPPEMQCSVRSGSAR